MRLPGDEELALATIAAAVDAGIRVFDTARAYGDNERLVARALRDVPGARIVTKGGMARPNGEWLLDGRAKTLRADCEASLAALDGLPIDLYLVHAPDPRTPWATTVRALARLLEEGLVGHVGLANVNRAQLDEALAIVPVAAVQVGLSVLDDSAVRSGVLERCEQEGIALVAHSPLGGPRRKRALARSEALVAAAGRHGATVAEVALARLLALSPNVVPIPGARTPDAARSAARAATLVLDDEPSDTRLRVRRRSSADVVLVMGIPGAGKTRVAAGYAERGYARLNRDERGGSLRELAAQLDDILASGEERVVLDNTYLTRVARSYAVDAARSNGADIRCVFVDTPLAQAQVNLVERLLDRFGTLPSPEELRAAARNEQGLLLPTSQMRSARELEEPSVDEGFVEMQRVPFARAPETGRAGAFVAAPALASDWRPAVPRDAPVLVYDWRPGADGLDVDVPDAVEVAVCPHDAGPPSCWCRPPLPGLLLAFARRHGVDPARSVLIGSRPAHRTLAATVGARFVPVR
jgi:aryl-alcohol dehydrogenase-like predicted oxidoreductase